MFDAIHLHLMLNHAPLILVLVGALLAVMGELLHERWLRRAGLGLLVVAGLVTWAVSASGEGAEKRLRALRPESAALIQAHTHAADVAVPVFAFAAVVAAVALLLERKPRIARIAALLAAALAVAAFALAARAALLGGKISHPELAADGAAAPAALAPGSVPMRD